MNLAVADFSLTNTINDLTNSFLGVQKPRELYEDIAGTNKGIRKQGMPYMLEVEDEKGIYTYIFPRGAEQWREINQPRSTVTYTQAGAFMDVAGVLPPKIHLSGTFGYANPSGDVDAPNNRNDAWQKYLHLDEMIKMFYTKFAKKDLSGDVVNKSQWFSGGANKGFKNMTPARPDTPPVMRFYDFAMEKYWEVNLDSWQFLRNKERRMLYMYDLQFTALKAISPSDNSEKLREKYLKAPVAPSLNTFKATLKSMKDGIAKLQGFLKAVNKLVGAVKQNIDDAIVVINQVTATIEMAKDTSLSIATLPASQGLKLKTACLSLMNTVVTLTDVPHEHINAMRQNVRTGFLMEETTRNNKQVESPDTETTTNSVFTSDHQPQAYTILQHTISDQDTILSIATKYGVDWQQMVATNNLQPPFIASTYMAQFPVPKSEGTLAAPAVAGKITLYINDATISAEDILVINGQENVTVSTSTLGSILIQETLQSDYPMGTIVTVHSTKYNCLLPGDKIGIPGVAGTGVAADDKTFEETLFYIDEILDDDGEMTTTGDINVAKGMDNLIMQLGHRIVTKRGELAELGHPEYGSRLPEYIGMAGTPVWYKRAVLECEMTIKADPRIAAVTNAKISVDGTAIYFEGDVLPINQSDPILVNIPL